MKIIEYPLEREQDASLAIALGIFDGVHLGHRRLIELTVSEAKRRGLTPAVFTFPAEGGFKGAAPIYSTEEKLRLLSSLGIEVAIVADFSRTFGIEAEDFLTRVLACELKCGFAAAGYNFRFGKGAAGDAVLMRDTLSSLGIDCTVLEEQRWQGKELSSTVIRELLSEGEAREATELLGSPYRISSVVERGLGIGHCHGFPTVNTPVMAGMPLRSGVYATLVRLQRSEKLYTGVTNVGVCPTFGERELHAETMLVDFSGDLYGEPITLYFLEYLRGEERFSSPTALKEQIYSDAERARTITKRGYENGWKLD